MNKNEGHVPDRQQITIIITEEQTREWMPEIFLWADKKNIGPMELIAFLGVMRETMLDMVNGECILQEKMKVERS